MCSSVVWSGSPAISRCMRTTSPGRRSVVANGYAPEPSVPPYLEAQNFETLRERAQRVNLFHGSFTDRLAMEPAASLDAYVLLDAQDWMNDETLTALCARSPAPPARAPGSSSAPPPTNGCCGTRARRDPRAIRL